MDEQGDTVPESLEPTDPDAVQSEGEDTSTDQSEGTPESADKATAGADEKGSADKDDANNSDKKDKNNRRDKFSVFDIVHKFRVLFVDLGLIALIIVVIFVVVHRLWSNSRVLEKIEVSKTLDDQGLSSLSVSEKLADEIDKLQPDTTDLSTRHKLLEPGWELTDIQVPVT
jgi:hypothetical protein